MPTLTREDIANLTNLLGITGAQSTYGTPEDLTPGPSSTAALSALLGGSNPSTRVVDPGAVAPTTTSYDFGGGRTGSFKGVSQGVAATPYQYITDEKAQEAINADLERGEKGRQALNDLFLPGGAQDVANRASQRKMQEEAVAPTIQGQTQRDVEGMKAATAAQIAQDKLDAAAGAKPKLTSAETDLEDKLNGIGTLIPSIESQMKAANPVIGSNPNSTTGVMDWLGAKYHGALYKAGMGGTMADESINQLTGYLEAVLPRLVAANRLNLRQYNDLKLHVPQVGFTDEENWRRIQVVKQILGSLQTGIDITHGTLPPLPPGAVLDK